MDQAFHIPTLFDAKTRSLQPIVSTKTAASAQPISSKISHTKQPSQMELQSMATVESDAYRSTLKPWEEHSPDADRIYESPLECSKVLLLNNESTGGRQSKMQNVNSINAFKQRNMLVSNFQLTKLIKKDMNMFTAEKEDQRHAKTSLNALKTKKNVQKEASIDEQSSSFVQLVRKTVNEKKQDQQDLDQGLLSTRGIRIVPPNSNGKDGLELQITIRPIDEASKSSNMYQQEYSMQDAQHVFSIKTDQTEQTRRSAAFRNEPQNLDNIYERRLLVVAGQESQLNSGGEPTPLGSQGKTSSEMNDYYRHQSELFKNSQAKMARVVIQGMPATVGESSLLQSSNSDELLTSTIQLVKNREDNQTHSSINVYVDQKYPEKSIDQSSLGESAKRKSLTPDMHVHRDSTSSVLMPSFQGRRNPTFNDSDFNLPSSEVDAHLNLLAGIEVQLQSGRDSKTMLHSAEKRSNSITENFSESRILGSTQHLESPVEPYGTAGKPKFQAIYEQTDSNNQSSQPGQMMDQFMPKQINLAPFMMKQTKKKERRAASVEGFQLSGLQTQQVGKKARRQQRQFEQSAETELLDQGDPVMLNVNTRISSADFVGIEEIEIPEGQKSLAQMGYDPAQNQLQQTTNTQPSAVQFQPIKMSQVQMDAQINIKAMNSLSSRSPNQYIGHKKQFGVNRTTSQRNITLNNGANNVSTNKLGSQPSSNYGAQSLKKSQHGASKERLRDNQTVMDLPKINIQMGQRQNLSHHGSSDELYQSQLESSRIINETAGGSHNVTFYAMRPNTNIKELAQVKAINEAEQLSMRNTSTQIMHMQQNNSPTRINKRGSQYGDTSGRGSIDAYENADLAPVITGKELEQLDSKNSPDHVGNKPYK